MKTNRFENGSIEEAKEITRGPQRLVVPTPARVKKHATAERETPTRRAGRRRPALSAEPVTTVSVKIDVGFGNTLFIRGEGQGLSWDKGQPLTCSDGSTWVWSSMRAREQVTFKLLVNDQLWSRGENVIVAAGQQVEVVPMF